MALRRQGRKALALATLAEPSDKDSATDQRLLFCSILCCRSSGVTLKSICLGIRQAASRTLMLSYPALHKTPIDSPVRPFAACQLLGATVCENSGLTCQLPLSTYFAPYASLRLISLWGRTTERTARGDHIMWLHPRQAPATAYSFASLLTQMQVQFLVSQDMHILNDIIVGLRFCLAMAICLAAQLWALAGLL